MASSQLVAPAGASALGPVAAASEPDDFCDPWEIDDPDCPVDEGDEDPVEPVEPPIDDEPVDEEPSWEEEPIEPPIMWPAPPKGAYAKLHPNGRIAIAPKSAPKPVKAMIRAANSITKKPYKWGGGHRRWVDKGYDCSGAVSFVLRAGGYLTYPLNSGGFAKWGAKGAGNWVRIYAHKNHVFMVIAGLRFDTSAMGARGGKGPRWRDTVRPTKGFKLRHPVGL